MEAKNCFGVITVRAAMATLVLLMISGSLTAVHDTGDVAELVGFMGKRQEYALVIFNNIAGERCALMAVMMANPSARGLYPVTLSENQSNPGDLTACMDAYGSKKYEDVYKFYLTRAPLSPGAKQLMASGFVPKSKARKLKTVKQTAPAQTRETWNKVIIAGQTAVFESAPGQSKRIEVSAGVLKVFKTVQPYDFETKKRILEVKDGKVMLTGEDCDFKEIFVMGIRAEIPVCDNCKTCEDRCFLMAARISFDGTVTYGRPFLVVPRMIYPYYEEKEYRLTPPELVFADGVPFSVEVYATASGRFVAVGALVHDPVMNPTYFPLVAVHPGLNN